MLMYFRNELLTKIQPLSPSSLNKTYKQMFMYFRNEPLTKIQPYHKMRFLFCFSSLVFLCLLAFTGLE